jgi:hypothetical protein
MKMELLICVCLIGRILIILDKELAIPRELVYMVDFDTFKELVNKIFTNHKIGLEPTYTQNIRIQT